VKLSHNQIEVIRAQIARSIHLQTLQDDVLDHVCCALEDSEALDGEFEMAVHAAVNDLAPEGLVRLQRDTLLLLNVKHIVMKRFMYALGLVTAITSSMGICFKLLHLKGADFLLTYGLLSFTLLYVPLHVIVWYLSNPNSRSSEKVKIMFALLSAVLTGGAIVLRLFHIEGPVVENLFIIGAVVFSFGFLPIQFFNMYKRAVA